MDYPLVYKMSNDSTRVIADITAPESSARISIDVVARRTLPAVIAESLRKLIVEGQLTPGMRLNERALCEQLQVSRTPLREAFHLLSVDGLVEIEPNRGARVTALSEQDIRESFEIMEALEALSAELACKHITDTEIAEVKALTYEMQACHARQDLPAYYQLNRQIHDLISAASHNQRLAELYRSVNLRLENLRFRSNQKLTKWDQAMDEHIAMAKALEVRDAERMASIMRIHIRRKGEVVLETFRTITLEKDCSKSADE